ncbi:hypothetical protein [Amycolatopsis dendrobii]|uniref:DUF5666 domain-containing protein n=1 Tax=Amycolatopsis dendrobii TaxID=2760662 RepID=A0A7W3W223_9PSEU|nr:hypothetical protein [Amycolatopsis dendrobii]MBB1157249.1 hypothetical protein [Amycolatopsis dendrobii]
MTAPHPAPNPPAAPGPAWGAAPEPGQARKKRAKWIAGGTAAVLIAGGGGAIWAATSSSSSSSSTAAGPAASAGGPAGQGGPGGGLGSVLHGEFATSAGPKFTQTGEVTALSATSLTAKSADGFTKVYVIDSATATGVKTGEDVTIVATVNGDTATATSVTEAGAPPDGAGPGAG